MDARGVNPKLVFFFRRQHIGPLLISEQTVSDLLTMEDAIGAIEEVTHDQHLGNAVNYTRTHSYSGAGRYIATMQAVAYSLGVFGFKTYTITPEHQNFYVYLYSLETGSLLAILEANTLGQFRTGAATGVSVKYLSRKNSSSLAIIGSGFQARTQLEAACKVRDLRSAKVFSPNRSSRVAFAQEMSRHLDMNVRPVDSPSLALDAADIIITITNSTSPVFNSCDLEPGVHIAAVGGANPYVREIEVAALKKADLLVADDLAQLKCESGEFLKPVHTGEILWEQIQELWEVVGGATPGRINCNDITIFKSLGMALWDIAIAKFIYDKAILHNAGYRLNVP